MVNKMQKKIFFIVVFISFVISNGFAKCFLKVGTNAIHPPISYLDDKNQIIGFDIDIGKAVFEEMGCDYEFVDMKFDGLIPAVQSGKIDVIDCALSMTEERKKKVDFSDPYTNDGSVIVINKKDKSIKSMNDLKNKVVGVELGTIQEIVARENADKIGEIKVFNGDEIFMVIEQGKVDAIIGQNSIANFFLTIGKIKNVKTTGEKIDTRDMAFGIRKGNKNLTAKINKALAKIRENGVYDKIYNKWFGN
ncbi:MAG: basic amino acid ABC transporter substrate-binding protein [Rickettsiales bacterium]|jgi:polar amino acid transport system substrate-binding protein|nr:basic amino acid ABC transporter substrate-binding protein [Rickettsiales bacterium]